MKKLNKHGFTIVELVVVIAVIAILVGVLIPSFSGIVTKAKDSAALQEASNAYKLAVAEAWSDGKITAGEEQTVDGFKFAFTNANDQNAATVTSPDGFGYTVTVTDGKVTVTNSTND